MAIEAAFAKLSTELRALREALVNLRLAAVDEKPARGDLVLVDLYGDGADELLGFIEEALAAVDEGLRAVVPPVDLDRARRCLTIGHECFARLNRLFATDLGRYERIADLAGIGRRRGREWGVWALNVKTALDSCQQPLFDVNDALFGCWLEIGERIGATSVSVQATAIGHLTPPERTADAPLVP